MLIGAIIASAGFLIYIKANNNNRPDFRGAPPQMNQSQDSSSSNGTPPELPNGETTDNSANSTDAQNNEQTQSNS